MKLAPALPEFPHSTMLYLTISCLGLVAAFLAFQYFHRRRAQPATCVPHLYTDPEEIREILSGAILKESNFGEPITPLESRAWPNQRLVHTFDIDNSFTTTDEQYHQNFRSHVAGLLKMDTENWRDFSGRARELVRSASTGADAIDDKGSRPIVLVKFVQSTVLQMMIETLFVTPPLEDCGKEIETIAGKINTLWLASKSPAELASHRTRAEKKALQDTLLKVLGGGHECEVPQKSSLNLILPSYETLWRVVLRGFLEVRLRNAEARPHWQRLFTAFLADPSTDTFTARFLEPALVSVADIVKEVFRLYPPTKRIYRTIRRYGDIDETVGIDVEAVHRDPQLWGYDALLFRPSRWTKETPRNAFLPFGARRFRCPARSEFGPKAVGILIAALLERFDGWYVEGYRDEGDKPLENGRRDYESLVLDRPLLSI